MIYKILGVVFIFSIVGFFTFNFYQKNIQNSTVIEKEVVSPTSLLLYENQDENYSFSYPSNYKITELNGSKFIFTENHKLDSPIGISFNIVNQIPVNELFPDSVFTKKMFGNKEVYVGEIVPSMAKNINYLIPVRNEFLSLFIMPIFDSGVTNEHPKMEQITKELMETAEIIITTFRAN